MTSDFCGNGSLRALTTTHISGGLAWRMRQTYEKQGTKLITRKASSSSYCLGREHYSQFPTFSADHRWMKLYLNNTPSLLRYLRCAGLLKTGPPANSFIFLSAFPTKRCENMLAMSVSAAGRIQSIKSNNLIGNRTHDLPDCSIVLDQLRYRVSLLKYTGCPRRKGQYSGRLQYRSF
jgi:hypothetical protein